MRKGPVGPRIELPICVNIALLLSVERANTHGKGNKIGLLVREVVGGTGEVRRVADDPCRRAISSSLLVS
jgi:hypothetical protein